MGARHLKNRLVRVETDDQSNTVDIVGYKYNNQGIRVSKHTWSETNSVGNSDDVTVLYLIDASNHTGYAQVLEQWSDGAHPDITYTIGADIISQSSSAGVRHLLYDGHGSTRQLMDNDSEAIVDTYSYDAYGVMLGGNPAPGSSPATNLLYSGEHFDTDTQNYYLRARWYDQNNGRFNRMDPFAGNNQDPQSLHKYLYCHANPVNGIDPSGMLGIIGITVSISIISVVAGLMAGLINKVLFGGKFFKTFLMVTMTTFLALSMSVLWPPIAPYSYTIATFLTQTIWEWKVNGFRDPAESIVRIIIMTILTFFLGFGARRLNISQFSSVNVDRLTHALGIRDAFGRIVIETGKLTVEGVGVFAGIKRLTSELLGFFSS